MDHLTNREWIDVALALSSFVLAITTAVAAWAAMATAKAAKSQMNLLERQARATEEGVEVRREAIAAQSNPRIALIRDSPTQPKVEFQAANLDGGGGGIGEDSLYFFMKNTGPGVADVHSARVMNENGNEFPLADPTPQVPGRTAQFAMRFNVPQRTVEDATEFLLQVDYVAPNGKHQKVSARVSPTAGTAGWRIAQDETYSDWE